MYSGGIADKAGNRFEARWLALQLFDLIDGKAVSVTVEKLGDGETGFEFSVDRPDIVEWHQCKRQNSRGVWTTNDLKREAVLENFRAKLEQSPAMRCEFVSTNAARDIPWLKLKRQPATDREDFERLIPAGDMARWKDLIAALDVDPDVAFDWLARSKFHAVSEDMLERIVSAQAVYWFSGEADNLVDAIRSWVERDEIFNHPIDRTQFLAFAANKGFRLKQYEADQTLPGRLDERTAHYERSYERGGAQQFVIERAETKALIETLIAGSAIRTVMIAGSAGSGKSAVVRSAIRELSRRGYVQLAFRVDQIGEPLSLAQLGMAVIDIDDSPAVVLARVAGARHVFLYIDQADAVSQVAGRNAHVRRQILDLVEQAERYPNIRVVFSCRTFDIENDQQFLELAKRPTTARIDIPPFDWERDVVPQLQRLGILVNGENPRLRALLVQPIGLTVAAELAANGRQDLRNVEHLSELYAALVDLKEAALRARTQPPAWSLYRVLEVIAEDMSRRQELVAPLRLLDEFAGAPTLLQQEGLIVVEGQRLSLLHESLFDFLHARAFAASGRSLLEFLLADEQTLFRRTQVRQILSQQRELDRKRYRADLRAILLSGEVRPHIRDLVLRWLAMVADPSADEWDILLEYSRSAGDNETPRALAKVIFDQPAWLDFVERHGLGRWLDADDEQISDWAFHYLRSVSARAGDRVAPILGRYLDRHPDKAGRLIAQLRWQAPQQAAPELAAQFVRAFALIAEIEAEGRGDFEEGPLGFFRSWTEYSPVEACELLDASLAAWFRLHPTGHPFAAFDSGGGATHYLSQLAKACPEEMVRVLLPHMLTAMRRSPGDELAEQDRIWKYRQCEAGDEGAEELIDLVREALGTIAKEDPQAAAAILRTADPEHQITSLHLLLEAVSMAGGPLAGLLSEHLDHPHLFSAGWNDALAYSAARALAATWDSLLPETRERFEARTLAYWPETMYFHWLIELRDPSESRSIGEDEGIRTAARYSLDRLGKSQWSILREIGAARLSPAAAARLAVYERKFAGWRPEIPVCHQVHSIGSPIAAERAARMSDATWLMAMRKIRSGRAVFSAHGELRGGSNELAHVLQQEVKKAPDRFLALLPDFPDDANPAFASAVVMGLREVSPTAEQTETIFALVAANKLVGVSDRNLIMLIQATGDAYGPAAAHYLEHMVVSGTTDSGVGEQEGQANEKPEAEHKKAMKRGSFLETQAANSARGAAIQSVGQQAWEDQQQFTSWAPLIDDVVGTELPAHIHAALGAMLLAALRHDSARAANWVAKTARACAPALFTQHGRRALRWLDRVNHHAAKPLILDLLAAENSSERAIGAHIVAIRALEDDGWHDVAAALIEKGPLERAAMAEVAAGFIVSEEHAPQASRWLERFFEDDDEFVRRAAVDCFRRLDGTSIAAHRSLYEAYVRSRHFDPDRTYFIHRLENISAAMDDLALDLIEQVVDAARTSDKKNSTGLYQLWDPVFRIYGSSEDNLERLKRSLDLIDLLILHDPVGGDKLRQMS